MQAENLIFDQSSQREKVKGICKVLPNVGSGVLSQAFIIETVNLCDLPAFVIATQNGNSARISNFEGEEQGNGLDTVVASINIITHE